MAILLLALAVPAFASDVVGHAAKDAGKGSVKVVSVTGKDAAKGTAKVVRHLF